MSTSFIVRVEQSTLVETLRTWALRRPEQLAYTYLTDGEREEIHLSYAELDRKARAIAALLQESGASGERVLLLYPQGLEYLAAFFGCLYAGSVAVPLYLPTPTHLKRTLTRIQTILRNAEPHTVLTTSGALTIITDQFSTLGFRHVQCQATDTLPLHMAEYWREPEIDNGTLAMLQYTSGSTSAPKGVMVSHGNLVHNFRLQQHAEAYPEESIYVSWLPLFHDMGLIGNALQPLYWGYKTVLLSPLAFLQRPARWLQAITRYHATTSGGPNFAYDLCTQKITEEQRATLDLSSWRYAFSGAEPIRLPTLERFSKTFAPHGFRRAALCPLYGLAESTLIVTANGPKTFRALSLESEALGNHHAIRSANPDDPTFVSCGTPCLDQRVRIVDPRTLRPCEAGQIGEIWISGPSVAQGYWRQAEETERTFCAWVAESSDGPFLRTGDFGFLMQNELYITGRLKDIIIIDGRNHYPQDIEQTVEQSHPALRLNNSAAFSIDASEGEQIVVVAEIERHYQSTEDELTASSPQRTPLEATTLHRAIRQAVSEQHDLQVSHIVLIKPGTLPKTTSGKIQRHMCQAKFLAGTLDLWGGKHGATESTRQ